MHTSSSRRWEWRSVVMKKTWLANLWWRSSWRDGFPLEMLSFRWSPCICHHLSPPRDTGLVSLCFHSDTVLVHQRDSVSWLAYGNCYPVSDQISCMRDLTMMKLPWPWRPATLKDHWWCTWARWCPPLTRDVSMLSEEFSLARLPLEWRPVSWDPTTSPERRRTCMRRAFRGITVDLKLRVACPCSILHSVQV